MLELYEIVNKLHELQKIVSLEDSITPQIVLIGSRGAGKTSLIEQLVNYNLLPLSGASTRCPTIIVLQNNNSNYVTFDHLSKLKFVEEKDVQNEIKGITLQYAGKGYGISTKPIVLKLHSPDFCNNIMLLDLPGFIEVPEGDQSQRDQKLINEIAWRYLTVPHTIILAVIPATTNLAHNQALELAKKANPSGSRTIIVLTKLDMASGSVVDITPTLSGKGITPSVRHVVVVIGRGQKGNKERRKFTDVLKHERKFLQAKYPKIAKNHGFHSLQKSLSDILKEFLLSRLPEYRLILNKEVHLAENSVLATKRDISDPGRIILEQITMYANAYCAQLSGTTLEIETQQLVGGARISCIFREVFAESLDDIDPLKGLTRPHILTALRNTSGTRPDVIFVPESGFENLARRQVHLYVDVSRQCMDMVYGEMIRLIKECSKQLFPDRYPKLYHTIFTVAAELVERCRTNCAELVEQLLEMELSYINTMDADFLRELDTAKIRWLITRGLLTPTQPGAAMTQPVIGQPKPKQQSDSISWLSTLLNLRGDDNTQAADAADAAAAGALPAAPTAPPASEQVIAVIHSSPKEDADGQLVEHLIASYMKTVKRTLKDSVPKAIMLRLVNVVHATLYGTLLERIPCAHHEESLLQEPDEVLKQRDQLTAHLLKLRDAQDVLSQVQEQLLSQHQLI